MQNRNTSPLPAIFSFFLFSDYREREREDRILAPISFIITVSTERTTPLQPFLAEFQFQVFLSPRQGFSHSPLMPLVSCFPPPLFFFFFCNLCNVSKSARALFWKNSSSNVPMVSIYEFHCLIPFAHAP